MRYVGIVIDEWCFKNEPLEKLYMIMIENEVRMHPSRLRVIAERFYGIKNDKS